MSGLAPSVEELMAKSRELADARGQSVEAFIRVYLETTGLGVDEVELVTATEYTGASVVQRTWVRRRRS